MQLLIKIIISALVIAAASELGKKSTGLAAILAALPMTTILTLIWLYADTHDAGKAAELSVSIFWAILPSFIFLISFPLLIRSGLRFPLAMLSSCVLMVLGYGVYVWALKKIGIQI
jgi:hypothetical protein